MMCDFELASNSGRELLRFSPKDILHGRDGPLLVCDIRFEGDHREVSDEKPMGMFVSELPLSISSLRDAAMRLQLWLDLPLDKQKATALEMHLPFSSSLELDFGARNDIVSSGHEVLTLRLRVGFFRTEVVFATDQSCIRIFGAGLKAALAEAGA